MISGAGLCNAIYIKEKYYHIPILLLFPATYTG